MRISAAQGCCGGILDACLLALIEQRDRYGYELAAALHEAGLPNVKEGSIHPLLSRLDQRGLVDSSRGAATAGPPRRYYRLTAAGRDELAVARQMWSQVAGGVDAVLATDRKPTSQNTES